MCFSPGCLQEPGLKVPPLYKMDVSSSSSLFVFVAHRHCRRPRHRCPRHPRHLSASARWATAPVEALPHLPRARARRRSGEAALADAPLRMRSPRAGDETPSCPAGLIFPFHRVLLLLRHHRVSGWGTMDLGNCGITANLLCHHRVMAGVFDSNPIPIQPRSANTTPRTWKH